MKKLYLICFLGGLFLLQSANSAIIFRARLNNVYYKFTNAENVKKRYHRTVYLVMDYDSSTQQFGNVNLIVLWKSGGVYNMETISWSGTVSNVTVSNTPRLKFTLTKNDKNDKDFMTLLSDQLKMTGRITSDYKLPSRLDGRRVFEVVNSLGERQIGSMRYRFKLSVPLSTQYISDSASDAVSSMVSNFKDKGYETTHDDNN